MEILHAAAQLSRVQRDRGIDARAGLYGLDGGGRLSLESGLRLDLDGAASDLPASDLLILPAIWRHPRRVLLRAAPVFDTLKQRYEEGTTICSVGSASSLLAAAGLLSGRVATTHWQDFDRFETSYPDVLLKRRHLITRSDRLYCVGSVNSIADFMVHLLGRWYGDRIARAVEAQFSPEARQSFASAAFLEDAPESHHDPLVREAQDFMELYPAERHSLETLARRARLSSRSFGRRFRQATGRTPMDYLRDLRLREARSLLLKSDLSIADVGWRSGFTSPSRFAQVFRAQLGLSPRAYREAVRGKRFGAIDLVPDKHGS